jgi:VanZ family protein
LRKIVIILCLFWMGFIFYMSSTNGEISHQESTKIVDLIKNSEVKMQDRGENKTTNENSKIDKNTINIQQVEENKLDHVIRKNAHAFMYMILAFLVSNVLFVFNKRGKDTIIYILFICLFYAVTDEFHQSFVLGRTSLVSDVLVDFGGTLIGLTFFYLAYYKIYKRYKKYGN